MNARGPEGKAEGKNRRVKAGTSQCWNGHGKPFCDKVTPKGKMIYIAPYYNKSWSNFIGVFR